MPFLFQPPVQIAQALDSQGDSVADGGFVLLLQSSHLRVDLADEPPVARRAGPQQGLLQFPVLSADRGPLGRLRLVQDGQHVLVIQGQRGQAVRVAGEPDQPDQIVRPPGQLLPVALDEIPEYPLDHV